MPKQTILFDRKGVDMEVECEQRITRLEESTKSAHHRIDDLSEVAKEIRTLALGLNSMNSDVKQVKESQDTIIKKVEEIELRPAKRWDQVTMAAICAIIAAFAGYLIGKVL